eukprot:14478594-Alexandrium_andersonii.AAC.1
MPTVFTAPQAHTVEINPLLWLHGRQRRSYCHQRPRHLATAHVNRDARRRTLRAPAQRPEKQLGMD